MSRKSSLASQSSYQHFSAVVDWQIRSRFTLKSDLINCAGWEDELFRLVEFCPTPKILRIDKCREASSQLIQKIRFFKKENDLRISIVRGKIPSRRYTLEKINHFQNDLRINKCRKNERRRRMKKKFKIVNKRTTIDLGIIKYSYRRGRHTL